MYSNTAVLDAVVVRWLVFQAGGTVDAVAVVVSPSGGRGGG